MDIPSLTGILGAELQDAEAEVFYLFSQSDTSHALGMIDHEASEVSTSVAGKDLTIQQSPALLTSNRDGGTTGAVVWKVTTLFAEWIASPTNLLSKYGVIRPDSVAVELGTGVSGLVALTLGPKIGRYLATDQAYVLKLLKQNLMANDPVYAGMLGNPERKTKKKPSKARTDTAGAISVHTFDWETDQASVSLLTKSFAQEKAPPMDGPDLVIACDCIYNEALVEPLVNACVDWCKLRQNDSSTAHGPSICIVALQLRSVEVFSFWLETFCQSFRVWRLTEELSSPDFSDSTGYALFLGMLRESDEPR